MEQPSRHQPDTTSATLLRRSKAGIVPLRLTKARSVTSCCCKQLQVASEKHTGLSTVGLALDIIKRVPNFGRLHLQVHEVRNLYVHSNRHEQLSQ